MSRTQGKLMQVKVKLPWVEGTWMLDGDQCKASWELYVELITRIAVEPLREEEGVIREALTSLYDVFRYTRNILREYGPGVARPLGKGNLSFGIIAVDVLNGLLRPFLAKWHPKLLDHENDPKKPSNISNVQWERQWTYNRALREELAQVQNSMRQYASLLANVAAVPNLLESE